MELFQLHNKTALITGSSRGIGRGILEAFVAAGARVIMHGSAENDRVNTLLAEIRTRGGQVDFISGDLSLPEGGRILAERALSLAPVVDILVLNASIQIRKPWLEITQEEASLQWQTNLLSSLELLQTLVPAMQRQQWGRIVSVGSVQERKAHPQMAIYAASKAAQTHLVLNLARQLASDGITANNLAPGVIETDRNAAILADENYAATIRAAIPSGIIGTPRDCVGAALLLCSDAGRYITGQNLFVDGGMSL